MNWYVIFVNKDKINELIFYFNNLPGINAFIPRIEKLISKEGKKEFLEVPMFPNYLFIETSLNEQEFSEMIKELKKDLGSTMKTLQDETQTIFALTIEEKKLLESLLNENHLIKHSIGIIVNSKLIVEEGPLKGKEELVRKIDRHKRLAFLHNVCGKLMKVPLEVISKS
ncbi:transcription termination/antitermination NusG family protein [Thomasclavelia sp.]